MFTFTHMYDMHCDDVAHIVFDSLLTFAFEQLAQVRAPMKNGTDINATSAWELMSETGTEIAINIATVTMNNQQMAQVSGVTSWCL